MNLTTTPTVLACAECGDPIEDTGYLPAVERDDGYDPQQGRHSAAPAR